MMWNSQIRLIAVDLDGTLLNPEKELTPRTLAALFAASGAGIEIVPATGRFYLGMPEPVRALPFLRYAITINGAAVEDLVRQRTIYEAQLPLAEALEILAWLDRWPVIYDCYLDGWGYMTGAMQDRAAEFAPDRHYLKMLRELRRPVPELKAHLAQQGRDIQKIQVFAHDAADRDRLCAQLERRFPDLSITASVRNNLEINHRQANKGDALEFLARHLGLSMDQTMAFGDGRNDIRMLSAAGCGVAMGNALPEVRAVADQMTGSCGQDGVARVIEELLGR